MKPHTPNASERDELKQQLKSLMVSWSFSPDIEPDERLIDFIDQYTKQREQTLLERVRDEVIGENKYSGEFSFDATPCDNIQNELRCEQRQALDKLKGEQTNET